MQLTHYCTIALLLRWITTVSVRVLCTWAGLYTVVRKWTGFTSWWTGLDRISKTDPSPPSVWCSLVLEVDEFSVDDVDVDVVPRRVVVSADLLQHVVVQSVQFLQQVQLLANSLQLRILGHLESEQLLAARVRQVLAPQVVEADHEEVETVWRFARTNAVDHRTAVREQRLPHHISQRNILIRLHSQHTTLLSFITPQGQHKTFTYPQTNIHIQTNMQSRNHKIIKSHQNHVSQKAAETFWNTAYFIASTPLYEHRPYFERKALHIFLFRYAKVLSTLLADWLIFSQKIIYSNLLTIGNTQPARADSCNRPSALISIKCSIIWKQSI